MKEALRLLLTKELDTDIVAALGKVDDEDEIMEGAFVQLVRDVRQLNGIANTMGLLDNRIRQG